MPNLYFSGSKVSAAMAEKGWNQTRLCQESGVDMAMMYRLLRDQRLPSYDTAAKIALAMGVSLDSFLRDDVVQ